MKFEKLRALTCRVNKELGAAGLAPFTWGNASVADRRFGVMAIKPSGVEYTHLKPKDIVVLDLASGQKLDSVNNPSSDTATHLELYRSFEEIGAVVHTHSRFATAWAQALKPIPCYGTTHADVFRGPVPVTRGIKKAEIDAGYETNTGRLIVNHFKVNGLDYRSLPGVLIGGHGPFTWGASAFAALEHAQMLEELAQTAYYTHCINPSAGDIPVYLRDKHYLRKHGDQAYYGQRTVKPDRLR